MDEPDTASMPLDTDDDVRTYLRRQQQRSQETKESIELLRQTTSELSTQAAAHDRGQIEILKRLGDQDVAMAQNTEITQQIRDLWKAGNIGTRALVWIGTLCGGLAGIVSLFFAFRK